MPFKFEIQWTNFGIFFLKKFGVSEGGFTILLDLVASAFGVVCGALIFRSHGIGLISIFVGHPIRMCGGSADGF